MDTAPSPERALFERALSLPTDERDAFLARERPNPDVAMRVRGLPHGRAEPSGANSSLTALEPT